MTSDHYVIVGAGASGTAAFIALVRELERLPAGVAARTVVSIVERSGDFGPGLPYGAGTDPLHLLNMRAATMSLIADEPADFTGWLAGQGPVPETYPRAPEDMLASRHRFGVYARQRLAEYTGRARMLGASVHLLSDTATGVVAEAAGTLRVSLASGSILWADRLVTATGHWHPSSTDHCRDLGERLAADGSGALLFPWPAARLAASVQPGAIGLLGTSLTAVDAALTIAARFGEFERIEPGRYRYHPREPFTITACSRRGLLPAVQVDRAAARSCEDNPYLVTEPLAELGEGAGRFTADAVARRYEAARRWLRPSPGPAAADGEDGDVTGREHLALRRSIDAWRHRDPATATGQELARVFFGTLWWIYKQLPAAERRAVWREFMTPYLVDSAAIPIENAARIEALLDAGVLRVRSGATGVRPQERGFAVTFADGAPLHTAYLVNAIGRETGLGEGTGFARAALAAGVLVADPVAGIGVDPETSLALTDDGGTYGRVGVLGQLTMGSHIGASAVSSCVKRATALVRAWTADLRVAPTTGETR
ncbi:hypothetical protein Cs7R123_02310 [Catellatospora sp. TT07R-123]|uniref:FAD/NAD(P)-binding protein n=1 Tax=Catellatospora sp. TT07R-123 TaxID=2733863 RepID=UPI001AFFD92D|nr:FAD/NAD(P)-binding protein [Catellatospora sp. TT07R-123]GHJ42889.1 hypothetical protein Cs7R123_02310 [Catellatospora sp. TT07R-123]